MNPESLYFCHSKVVVPDENLCKNIKNKLGKVNLINQPYKRCDNLNDIDHFFLVSEKIKHSRNFLLFLTNINNKNYTILVDIDNMFKHKYYLLNLRFDQRLYFKMGTLFTSELVYNDKSCWLLLLNDIIFNSNRCVVNQSLQTKIQMMGDILKNQYNYDDYMNPFFIQIKSYYLFNHLENITGDKTLYFHPENTSKPIYVLNVCEEKKEKEEYETKEYNVVKGDLPDIYKIYDNQGMFINILTVKKLTESKKLKEFFKDKTQMSILLENKNNEWRIVE